MARVQKKKVGAAGPLGVNDDYKQFLGSLQLIGVVLLSARFSIDRQRFQSEPAEIHLETEYTAEKTGDTGFRVRASLVLTSQSSKPQKPTLDIAQSYELFFTLPSLPPDLHHIKRFAASEARLIAWPYFREFIQSMCGRAEIPGVVLPLTGIR